VWHGCQAGLQQEARVDVYHDRILKGTGSDGFYSINKLGAIGSDLGAVACFFDLRWSKVSPLLSAPDQGWLLNLAAFHLRALGRLRESVEPMRVGLKAAITAADWRNAAVGAGNLSELSSGRGDVTDAVEFARRSVDYADRSRDAFERMSKRTTLADALYQSGQNDDARAAFEEAERLQQEWQPEYPLLYSFWGFRYCDLLLAPIERAAWQSCRPSLPREHSHDQTVAPATTLSMAVLSDVEQRGQKMFEWRTPSDPLLDIGLDHLTLARVALYRSLLTGSPIPTPGDRASHIAQAVAGLRKAGDITLVPHGLLTSAWTRHATGDTDGAQRDLDETWEIAERGPMPLFQADVLLYRARLFGLGYADRTPSGPYPWGSPADDLAAARTLITKHGYGRRLPELEDAERAL